MHFARVVGTVVATQKDKHLEGMLLRVIEPCDESGKVTGTPVVAVDPLRSREGDLVIWVSKREASLAIPGAEIANFYPVDAAITGLVDWIGSRKSTANVCTHSSEVRQ